MTSEACLICRHMVGIAPADWKPDYPGKDYDRYEVRRAIKCTKTHQKVWCVLNPVWLEVNSNHYCGQFAHFDGAFGEDLRAFLGRSWTAQENERLTADNVELKRQLKLSRERSSQRLKRLKRSKPLITKAE